MRSSLRLPAVPCRSGIAAIGAQVQLGALRSPDRVAIELFGVGTRSYSELDERTNRLAQALLGIGLARGARVAIWLGNCLEYMDAYLACAKAGLVVVQINILHKSLEARYQLENSGAEALIFDDSVAGYVDELGVADGVRLMLATGSQRVPGTVSFEDFLSTGANDMPPHPDDEDMLVIGYTSGTTGFPKGAILTHRSVKTLGQTNALTSRYTAGSVQVFGLSLSFSAGIPAHVLPHLYVGGTSVILPEWDTEALVTAIERRHATFTILPTPSIVEFCSEAERDASRIGSLVSVLHSSSKASPEHLEHLVDVIGPRLVEGWGMTENSGGLVAATVAADYRTRDREIFDSTGRAAPDAVIRLLDELGNPLPHDGQTVGQLVAHSASLAQGYWKNPEASRATFRGGWYFSGDLGRIDADGYVYIVDRRSDLIVSGGMNVYPSEVERVILMLPGVRDCSVVPASHPRWGQTPVAFVIVDNPGVTPEAIIDHCVRLMASYKKPTQVHIVSDFPRNASGKVLRRELQTRLASGLPEAGAADRPAISGAAAVRSGRQRAGADLAHSRRAVG